MLRRTPTGKSASGDPSRPQSQIALRSLAGYAIFIRSVLGFVVRVHIFLAAPLKPQQPLLWLAVGMIEGLAVSSIISIVCIAIGRSRRTDAARGLLVAVFVLNAALYLVFAEVIAYLGQGLHLQVLELGLHPRFFAGSVEGGAGIRIAILLVLMMCALVWANARAMRAQSTRVTLPRLCAIVVLGVLAFLAAPYIHLSETTGGPVVQLLNLLDERRRNQQLHRLIDVPRSSLPSTSIRALMPPLHRDFIDDRYPLAYIPPPRSAAAIRLAPGVAPNIVIVLLESMRSAEVGAYGGNISGLTPNFDLLARNGILIDDAYSVGGYTPEGELGTWYGLLASPYEIVVRNRPDAVLSGLPEFLRERGYQLLWAHPGDQTLYLSSRFYLQRGFHAYDGTSFSGREPRTNWGYSDKALARHMIAMLDHVREPFAAMELTISNHHPFELPSDASPFRLRLPLSESEHERLRQDRLIGQRTIPMLRTIHYSDEALGLFFQMARTKPWFRRTIFVIVGDHGTPTRPLDHPIRSLHELMMLRHHVAMLFYSPLLPKGIRIAGPASHADVLPTLEGLLGSTAPRAGIGVDLLDPADRGQDRPVISWNPEARTVTVTTAGFSYHAAVANLGTTPIEFSSETLIDDRKDPVGMSNLAYIREAQTKHLRDVARFYVELYPSLIASGESGLPSKKP